MEYRMKHIQSLRERLDALGKLMKQLQSYVAQANARLAKHYFIEEDLGKRTVEMLQTAGEEYALCRKAYADLFGIREFPDKLETAKADLLKEEDRVRKAMKRKKASLFFELRSQREDINASLRGKKEKLRDLLKNSQSGDSIESEKLLPYLVFMEALELQDSAKIIEYIQKLSPYFDAALLGCALIERGITGANLNIEPGKAAVPSAGQDSAKAEPVDERKEPDTFATVEIPKDDNENGGIEPEKALELLSQKGFRYLSEDDYKGFGCSRNENNEEKEFKASKFKTDVVFKAPDEKEKLFALRQLCLHNYSSVGLLRGVSKNGAEAAERALEFLKEKGYARKYWIDPFGSFYGTSPRLHRMMTSQDATNILHVPCQKRFDDEWVEDVAVNAAPRLAYVRLKETMLECRDCIADASMTKIPSKEKELKETTQIMMHNAFIGRYVHKKEEDIAFGCFWAGKEEYLQFLAPFAKQMEKTDSILRVIVASTTKEQAYKAYEILSALAKMDLADIGRLYFYALSEQCFYEGKEQKGIEPQEIWKKEEAPAEKESWEEDVFLGEAESSDDVRMQENVSERTDPDAGFSLPEKDNEREAERIGEELSAVRLEMSQEKTSAEEEEKTGYDTEEERGLGEIGSELIDHVSEPVKEIKEELAETPPDEISLPSETMGKEEGKADSGETDDSGNEKEADFWKVSAAMPESSEAVMETVQKLLAKGKAYCAAAYLKACAMENKEWEPMYRRLAYAVNDPMEPCNYQSDEVITLFGSDRTPFTDDLMAAAAVRTLLFDNVDYRTQGLLEAVKLCQVVPETEGFSDLLFDLMQFKQATRKGVDAYADYRRQNRVETERKLERVRQEARDAYAKYAENVVREKKMQKRFIATKERIFDQENELVFLLKMVKDNDRSYLGSMQEYLREHVLKDGAFIDKSNISQEKIDEMIDDAWNESERDVTRVKKTTSLMGSLRNNLYVSIVKVADILCRYVQCMESLSDESEDEGRREYVKIRKQLLKNANLAIAAICRQRDCVNDLSGQAGLSVVEDVLREFSGRLEGIYPMEGNKYFYVDFLRSDHVLLDDGYLPELQRSFDDAAHNSAFARILAHAAMELPTMEERIREAFNGGDDLHSARLLDNCLKERIGKSVIEENQYDYRQSVKYAEAAAKQQMEAFQANLELAQSYGQIDDEEKKEKILQTVGHWYEYAKETENFGVFRRVKDYWEKKIHEYALPRKAQLERELDGIIEEMVETPGLEARTGKIRQMIDLQNYTVAEDMLNRLRRGEPEDADAMRSLFERDYLKDFLENYDRYYERVSEGKYSLQKLLGHQYNFPHNKEERSGALLVWNWVSNLSANDEEKLKTLLDTLGFPVEKVERIPQVQVGSRKIDNYTISLRRPPNGKKANYRHPISSFGSEAVQSGFRVACLFGRYDANALIEWFKEMGNAKNTIVLLDWALDLPTRRRLARKVREELQGKVFGVIDRVLLMYLIKHYDIMHINQMLMALMMPFAHCQPYVWESSQVMPPEIFMGRKKELKEIEDSQGVNIVYGGRQLGKSAMLKMARNDIDRNENNDRAILVDIKDLDYEKAARKISQTLTDEGFFERDVDTSDWDELARAVKQRLQSSSASYIPYFLLLLDEADAFIESCGEDGKFHPFDALKDIQSIGTGRFKFVIAGLRNVIRFNRDKALSGNTVLPHLKSLTVKPFQMAEARELLEVPLYYLGLRFPKGSESLISLILASTNYFPGLIQFYCAKLIEAMTTNYAGYNESSTPIYEISEQHIKTVLKDEGFRDQIRQKFDITLKLGNDKYYYAIALLIAYLYHENDNDDGYSMEDLRVAAADFDIRIITDISSENLASLLEDLCELNILRKTAKGKYLFTRYTFFQMMGSLDEVENKLLGIMEESE